MQTQIVTEIADNSVGEYIGQCKWFNDKLGYGFITIQSGEEKGKDIFVHHSGIRPLNSNYKTLKKGEYINFSVTNGDNGLQAINVTGICGGSLMCDVTPSFKQTNFMNNNPDVVASGFTVVVPRKKRSTPRPQPMQS
jgi:CspA family cold shock protein